MGENLYNLYPDKDPKLAEEIKDDLNTLSKVHVYFEFLRLEWLDKLEQAEKQNFQDVLDLLPRKNLTHMPMNLSTMQRQIMALWNHVLDILSPDGALRLWEKKKAETPALKAYSKEYKRRFAWIKYRKITKEAFYEWAEEARKKRDSCEKGDITLEEFRKWLYE